MPDLAGFSRVVAPAINLEEFLSPPKWRRLKPRLPGRGFNLRAALKGGVSNRSWFYDEDSGRFPRRWRVSSRNCVIPRILRVRARARVRARGGNQGAGLAKAQQGGRNSEPYLSVDAHGMSVSVLVVEDTWADHASTGELIEGIDVRCLLAVRGCDTNEIVGKVEDAALV
ncbi:MAG: hypothetical protein LBO79_04355 [Zoogloeaceae bacterium]|jgi:hypothetical protein|nr:hypothetical protein [Zoogloeaceae bacterium]